METADIHSSRIFLVEDSAAIRTRLAAMLAKIAGLSIVGEADGPQDAIAGIIRTLPNCVVLDLQLFGGSGIEVLRAIKPVYPAIAFIVLTNKSEPQYRRFCMSHGADVFLDKSTEFEKVKELVVELTRD